MYVELLETRYTYITTVEVAEILGITVAAASRLVRQGRIPGVKIGRVYLVPRASVQEFRKGYVPKRGRPRKKRKYTKRSPAWTAGDGAAAG